VNFMKPQILITNDDGILSPGLLAVIEAVSDLGDLLIVAPRYQQTAMSRSMPTGPNIGIIEEMTLTVGGKPVTGYAVHGSPSLCVVHGIYELSETKPALCISGINYGENIGMTVANSGTVGAALEASLCGVPALAVSLEAEPQFHNAEDYAVMDWAMAGYFTRQFALKMLSQPLPPEIAVLNVNVPTTANEHTEIRVTTQSHQPYYYFVRASQRDRAQGFRVPLARAFDVDMLEPHSDIRAFVLDRVVTVTPLTGNLTAKIDAEQWYHNFWRD
jgi:5'-nucleotidase